MASIPGHTDHDQGFEGLDGLLERYDPLLGDASPELDQTAAEDLRTLARVFDLRVEADASAVEVWKSLRPALIKRLPTGLEDADPDPSPDAAGETLTILVVEDDEDTARTLVEGLTERGHSVVGPIATAEAASIVAGFHILDVALLDINLEGEDTGADLAKKLLVDWNIPTIFLSGDMAQSAQNADGALGYILKPYSINDVINALKLVPR